MLKKSSQDKFRIVRGHSLKGTMWISYKDCRMEAIKRGSIEESIETRSDKRNSLVE